MTSSKITLAFYNIENLFDTVDDPHKLDDDFTKKGRLAWDEKKYSKKLKKLSKVIDKIGKTEANTSPSIIGLAEVENKKVLKDLISQPKLAKNKYDFVHFNSPDERGIDTALLYKKEDFKVTHAKNHELYVETTPGIRDYTRDILEVQGVLKGIKVHILINHWPSRREGADVTQHKRIAAAKRNRDIIDLILAKDPDARIVIMGDFNDDPQSEAVRNHLVKTDLYNPMVFLLTRYEGSLNHKSDWYLFDQIILSPNWMKAYENPLEYLRSDVYNDHFLTEYGGKYKGNPFRTYAGKRYLGGYGDHFPVYTVFKVEQKSE